MIFAFQSVLCSSYFGSFFASFFASIFGCFLVRFWNHFGRLLEVKIEHFFIDFWYRFLIVFWSDFGVILGGFWEALGCRNRSFSASMFSLFLNVLPCVRVCVFGRLEVCVCVAPGPSKSGQKRPKRGQKWVKSSPKSGQERPKAAKERPKAANERYL